MQENKKILGRYLGFSFLFIIIFLIPTQKSLADSVYATTTVSITAIVLPTSTDPVTPVDGGGGGGGGSDATTSVPILTMPSIVFSGIAYPLSEVNLLIDGQDHTTVTAGFDARFSINMPSISPGSYTFSFSAEDSKSRRSVVYTIPVVILENLNVNISNIFIPPSISISQGISSFKIEGETAPGVLVNIYIDKDNIPASSVFSNSFGLYEKDFPYTSFLKGFHFAKTRFSIDGSPSGFSRIINFPLGFSFDSFVSDECRIVADLNIDCRVNLIDFSILAYWYERDGLIEGIDLNNDREIDLSDFSIMAYYWTG